MNSSANVSENQPISASRRKARLILMVILPALLLLVIGLFYLHGGRYVSTDNAFVKAHNIPVSSAISGPVQTVFINENENVKAGQPLFQIDPTPYQTSLNQAQAQQLQTVNELNTLKANYIEAKDQLSLAHTKSDYAKRDLNRMNQLIKDYAVSKQDLDQSRQNAQLSGQNIQLAEQNMQQIATQLGGNPNVDITTHPRYKAAEAAIKQAELNLARTTTYAPVNGKVGQVPKTGQYLAAGLTATSLISAEEYWIEANYPEKELTYVHPGQSAEIELDIYPGQHFKGQVQSISPATGAEFSVIPAQNATGNWVKVTQRLPVKITFNTGQKMPQLQSGLSANVTIDTTHKRKILGFSL